MGSVSKYMDPVENISFVFDIRWKCFFLARYQKQFLVIPRRSREEMRKYSKIWYSKQSVTDLIALLH